MDRDTSRPARARGLKLFAAGRGRVIPRSRPARARGLKHKVHVTCKCPEWSRPARARGLKPAIEAMRLLRTAVAPRAGAWIETCKQECGMTKKSGRAPRGRVD